MSDANFPTTQQAFGSQISSAFSSFTASLKPLGNQITHNLSQAQQFAKEKMGASNGDITELPAEYRQLEEVGVFETNQDSYQSE